MNAVTPGFGRDIVTILTMTPYTGVNNTILGVSNALGPKSSLEIRPSVPKDLIDAFKAKLKQIPWSETEFSPLVEAAARRLGERFAFIEALNRTAGPVVVINHGSSPKRILQGLALKKAIGRAVLVGLNYPGTAEDQFALTVVTPSRKWRPDYPSRLVPVGSVPNRMTTALLDGARREWAPVLRHGRRRLIAVLIGGDVGTKNKKNYRAFTTDHARQVIDLALSAAKESNADLVVSTSRRTPAPAIDLIETALAPTGATKCGRPPMLHVASRDLGPNPYVGMLACADAIIVTADSLSMLSEAVDSGKPVFVVKLPSLLRQEHMQLYRSLLEHRHVFELPTKLHFEAGKPIFAASTVAQEILRLIDAERSLAHAITL